LHFLVEISCSPRSKIEPSVILQELENGSVPQQQKEAMVMVIVIIPEQPEELVRRNFPQMGNPKGSIMEDRWESRNS
jgi:hypothetical protein